ncbi:hypothetical protein [Streptomyces sp. NPDC093094]|uniref:hypothetical protein n=1 Tax=Streptomyces sp. NPDC093094 TaxID=3366026 RepID=UPI0038071C06
MSEHRRSGHETHPHPAGDAMGGYGAQEAPRVPPNVYHPHAAGSAPVYDAYHDPAAAHGWQNAYDETAQLPRVTEQGADVPAGRAAARRGARRAAARRDRRMAAAGALGVLSLTALVAGFTLGGSSDDGPADRRDRTGPTAPDATDSAGSAVPEADGTAAESSPASDPRSRPLSGPPSVSPSAASSSPVPAASAPAAPAGTPRPTVPATTAPPAEPTAPASTPGDWGDWGDGDGGGGKPGHGYGRPKGSG